MLSSGDPTAGAVIIVTRTRDGIITALTKTNRGDGQVTWDVLLKNESEGGDSLQNTLERQRRFDPDLWVIELDIANPAQFIEDEGTIR